MIEPADLETPTYTRKGKRPPNLIRGDVLVITAARAKFAGKVLGLLADEIHKGCPIPDCDVCKREMKLRDRALLLRSFFFSLGKQEQNIIRRAIREIKKLKT